MDFLNNIWQVELSEYNDIDDFFFTTGKKEEDVATSQLATTTVCGYTEEMTDKSVTFYLHLEKVSSPVCKFLDYLTITWLIAYYQHFL